ncbi:helix-turn-helix transcriptional regulator [Phycicoccus sp. SLBN-51]|uniref:helix-turn-helix domain-containing protein n=1 Tax=Phycicoccus sp. SLBN-51 TaxID=2768447 RepID=UPI00114FAFFB|nr:helix-turn-helix transcriptional regulator [Phycicoccus sp. SLBN-51]TQJ49015.1 helix-turn-helix protein [Phycicoccus sp. SLBN-51]
MGEQRWTEQQWDEQQWDEQQWGDEGQVVAGYVARARRIADLSQRELAQRLGVGPATVGRWECGGTMAVVALTRVLALAGPVDHPTVAQLAELSAERRGRRARVLEPLPECGCPDACFEQPACAAECRCRCESPCSGFSGGRPLE